MSDVEDTHFKPEEEKKRIRGLVYQAMDKGISSLRSGALDVADSINKLIDYMERRGCSPSTISGHKFKLIKFYRYLKLDFDRDDLVETVKKVDDHGITDDRDFTRDQIREMLNKGNAKAGALVSFMTCTGARRSEAVQVKLSQIEWNKKVVHPDTREEIVVPGIVHFPARTTKTHRKRVSFLSSECVELLKSHIANRERFRTSEWLFEGWIPERDKSQPDKHVSPNSAYSMLRQVFALANLAPPMIDGGKVRESRTGAHNSYHPHIFRSTAINFMKSSGYPSDWSEFVAGHDIGTQESYLPPNDKLAAEWVKKCESSFCFRTGKTEVESLKITVANIENAMNELQKGNPKDRVIPVTDSKGETVLVVVPPETTAMKRWENHSFSYAKCEYGSEEFDKLLEEGYEQFGTLTKDNLAYLRKPKQA